MSTPERTAETPGLESTASERQESLTHSVGTRLAAPSAETKLPWWKRLLGRN